MDPNHWYYTLSSIAQTGGALIALGGTAAIFKLQNINKAKINYRDRVCKAMLQSVVPKEQIESLPKYSDNELLKIYKKYENNIVKDGGVVNEHVISAIQSNYGMTCQPPDWVKSNIDNFRGLVSDNRYVTILLCINLFIITAVIITNLAYLGLYEPDIIIINYLIWLSCASILTTIVLFGLILTKRHIDY